MTGRQPGRGAVVFDCDGVLADTQACWDSAFLVTADLFGVTLSPAALRRLRGASIRTAAAAISTAAARGIASQVSSARRSPPPREPGPVARVLHRELSATLSGADLRLLPGVEDALGIVCGGPTAVASNGPEDLLRTVLRRLGITHAFDVILSADHVSAPKPAPDLYRLACDRLDVPPARAVAVEDSTTGIAAARAAGLAVLAIGGNLARPPASLAVTTLADPAALNWLRRHSHSGHPTGPPQAP